MAKHYTAKLGQIAEPVADEVYEENACPFQLTPYW